MNMSELSDRLRLIADTNRHAQHEDEFLSAADECDEAAAELDRLQAIVDRLPKYRDGTPWTPDSKGYTDSPCVPVVSWSIRAKESWHRIGDCWPTREAAEKARTK
jgi:hypothetical protein